MRGFHHPERDMEILNHTVPDSWVKTILEMASKKPVYSDEVAAALGIDEDQAEDTLYLLEKAGLLSTAELPSHRRDRDAGSPDC
jgi:predicted ArsR family transcriptional regulator